RLARVHAQQPLTRSQVEDRHLDAGVGVELAFALVYPLPPPQEMGDQFLGRGLSSTPRDRHDRKGAAAKALGRHVEQRLAGVLDHDDGRTIDPLGWPLTENAGGAALNGLRDEDV